MRELSLTVRILVLSVLLPVTAAICVGALVVTGALHPRIVHMVAAGWGILIIAVLAAAISALGPKYRPTPLLTPLFAGIFAALLATTAFYAVRAYVSPNRSAVAAVNTKPATVAPAPAPAPVRAVVAPDLAATPPEPAMQPGYDTGTFTPPEKAQGQIQAGVQPLPDNTADNAAMGGPLVNVANAVVPPAAAAESPTADAHKPPVAMAKIPVPTVAPEKVAKRTVDTSVNLTARFDPSGPIEPAAEGPPMMLDTADTVPAHHASIPPLPRIRPCGGAGPACP